MDPSTSGESGEQGSNRFSRRTLLIGGGTLGVAALGGIAFGVDQWVESGAPPASPDVHSFRSRPDLHPAKITVVVPAAGTASGLVFLALLAGPGQMGPMIVDNLGNPIWLHPVKQGSAANLQVQSYRGKPVLAWWEGQVVSPGYGLGQGILMDSSYQQIARISAGDGLKVDLHELTLTPEGTALITVYQKKRADLSSVNGPRRGLLLDSLIQEIDIATGRVVFRWDAHDHVRLNESYVSVPQSGAPFDFFHINSIDVDTDGNLLISARHTWTVYKINRTTGEIMWRLNGKRSDFTMGPRTQFVFQHDARHQPGNEITLFDDGGGPQNVDARSRGLKLRLDFAQKRAEFVREFLPDPAFLTTSQGSMQVLDNGNAFVGWGSEPYWSEYASDGRLLFDAKLPTKGDSYRTFRFEWQGQPRSLPAMAAQRYHDRIKAWVSWNGATSVESWELLAGSSPGALSSVATAPRTGFETELSASTRATYVAVAARASSGKLLARSHAVRV
ncbi:MAG: arylsulfotransferase family protein [Acidimicrobiales bacterium]